MSWQSNDKSSKKPDERRKTKRSSSEINVTGDNQQKDASYPPKLQKEAETPIAQNMNAHVDKPDETQPPKLTEVDEIYMQTKTLLDEFLEKKEGDFAFLSELQTKITAQVAQMIEEVKGKAGDRYGQNEYTVRDLVSTIGSALHRIDELDQQRRQCREALTSVLSFIGD